MLQEDEMMTSRGEIGVRKQVGVSTDSAYGGPIGGMAS